MKLSVEEFLEDLEVVKETAPLYTPFCEIEYQLDEDKAVVLLSHPFENCEHSDYETVCMGIIAVDGVYDFVKAIHDKVDIIISDTTYGEHYHKYTLNYTLKEFAHLFDSNYGAGRDWEVEKAMTMEDWNKAHQLGDVIIVERLLEKVGPNAELSQLDIDSWEHEFFKDGGESYDTYKERLIKVTSQYVTDWDHALIEP